MIEEQLKQAKLACRKMQNIDKYTKMDALDAISKALLENTDYILGENAKDIANARDNGISEAMIDRLLLTRQRIEAIAKDVEKVADLKDCIGETVRKIERPNGLIIKQVRIPIGVVATIYESRPNVTVDIASICIKTNNVCVLKGGREAIHSNIALVNVINMAIRDILPTNVVTLIENTDRSVVFEVITANQYVDVVVPRGGAGLIQHVVNNATVPVIETGAGICHLYVDKEADLQMALKIAVNAKISRPSVCNAIETILVHQDIANPFLTKLRSEFAKIKIYGDEEALRYVDGQKADNQNYATEYDDYICNIKVVKNIDEAIEHIYNYSTKHSESIITENNNTAKYFMESLDSACVYHNASTRFTDGGEFGFGAEVGISTQKLHARGPIGLQEMTSTKYIIYGKGQIR
ncbi:glutamate-5-semialdehyde dehydrogenase [Thomasclavelia cocleata]|uniref:Gamma-glutamyl phosphate reductase n=2 Tax=Thomasclavelia cocleata TaxID=69824 RepID=A0A1I0EL87_9FIRM|nr:glutamate-5-semialdehyde dehydrogenase [Thomasclavelia cocleata]PJN80781.1 glutamate-5-semialdehyde dehydrogenase [Thomasclavelia cocleata]SET45733.1 glutamate-5-semialdehyde dehydrogenase [Thomasclavelia cocleata]